MVKLHCERAPALRAGPEVRCVAKHFAQRAYRVYNLRIAAAVRTFYAAAAMRRL